MDEVRSISLKNKLNRGILPKEQGYEENSSRGVKPNWPQLNDLCSYVGLIPAQKFQFGYLNIRISALYIIIRKRVMNTGLRHAKPARWGFIWRTNIYDETPH